MSEELVAEVILGDDAKAFLETDLGKYIAGRIEQDIQEAKDDFAEVDPDDVQAVKSLQNKLKVALKLKTYLVEIINAGDAAYQILEGEND